MKSFIFRLITLGLALSIIFMSWLGFNFPSLALPEPQVIEKIQQIPVFTIVNQDSKLVLISPKTNQNTDNPPNIFIFFDYNDSVKMAENLQKNNSDLAKSIKIAPISFSRVYEMLKDHKQEPTKIPPITLYSKQEEMQSAQKILEQRGESVENLQKLGLPLFFVTLGQDNEFVVQQHQQGKSFIPFYMELKEAQADLELYKKRLTERKPEEFKIQVVPLLEFIQILLQKDDEAIKLIEILPSKQQINEANRLLKNNPNQPSS